MKGSVSLVTLLGVVGGVAAAGHHHKHRHANRGSPVEKRVAAVTETVPGPVETVYELLNGVILSAEEVIKGVAEGKYVIVGDSDNSTVPSSTTASSTAIQGAAFVQITSSSTSSSTTIVVSTTSETSSTVVPTTSSTSSTVASTTAAASSPAASSTSSGGFPKIDEDFPNGVFDCDYFPEEYGAVNIDYLGLGGWTGVQKTPNHSPGDSLINYIVTAISGETCTPNSFCSYACPAGYQKSMWPSAQGATGQSIGGLYCNANGKLEISNSNFTTICIQGTGGITVENKLSLDVPICRTDYPGTEGETVPLLAQAGQAYPLTCPDANNYYQWEGAKTSAQYYVNPAGTPQSEGCIWGGSTGDLGNRAPVNFGVGRDSLGKTWASLIPNAPTNPDGELQMKITLDGDISGTCYYSYGKYYDSNGENKNGCTVEVFGTATYVLSD